MSDASLFVNPATSVVYLFGEYDIASDRYSVGDDLRGALRADGNQATLDLTGLKFADSCLVNALAQAALAGIRVNVKHPPRVVRLALDMTGVSDLVEID